VQIILTVYSNKLQAKMPQAPVKTSKAHSSEDAGHSIQKMEIEQRPLAKSTFLFVLSSLAIAIASKAMLAIV
jgi:hypothetical protein